MKKLLPSLLLSMASLAAAHDSCTSRPPTSYSKDVCQCSYCLGPIVYQGNAQARPHTCNGDIVIAVSAFEWKATQDGMEYAIEDNVEGDLFAPSAFPTMKNIVDGEYLTPKTKWTTGYRAKIGYNSPCDGWDFGLNWTSYRVANDDKIVAAPVDTGNVQENVFLTLWSAFHGIRDGAPNFAHKITTSWKLYLGLIDLELGREFWVSRYLSLRPFISLEGTQIKQRFGILHEGGYWVGAASAQQQSDANNEVQLDNNFRGIGVRSGFEGNWHFGCGWSLYSQMTASIISGRFSVEHTEDNRESIAPFSKYKVLETKNSFRASRPNLGLTFGFQYETLICDCSYGLKARLAFEQHLFFHQNQMWRVNRVDPEATNNLFPNNGGENVFLQRSGTLATQGLTLTFQFEF